MEIKTRFNINDEVWFIHPNSQRAVQGRVKEIIIKVSGKARYGITTDGKKGLIRTGEYDVQLRVHHYIIDDNVRREGIIKDDYALYSTKEALIESLKLKANSL